MGKGAKAMTGGALIAAISSKTGQKAKDVRSVFTTLSGIATSEVSKTGKFVIPQVVMLKLKHKAARPAGKRMMFGKEVKVAAKKASKVVKAFPVAALKGRLMEALGSEAPVALLDPGGRQLWSRHGSAFPVPPRAPARGAS